VSTTTSGPSSPNEEDVSEVPSEDGIEAATRGVWELDYPPNLSSFKWEDPVVRAMILGSEIPWSPAAKARAAVSAYLDALKRPDPCGWWPMASAPKDGTFIAIDLGVNLGIRKVRWAAEHPYPGWETDDEETVIAEPSMWRRLREGE
jgi:hypothetical protein